ncbi:MAG: amidohydrolase family protein [Rivularia sp. (in: cyanobacteria)]
MFSFPVHSADSHIIEPPDLWTKRIEPKFRERAPRVVQLEDTDLWIVEDNVTLAVVGIQNQAGLRFDNPELISKNDRYENIPELTPERYIQDLDSDKVVGSVLYSSNAHQAYRSAKQDLLCAIARTYNDWILEFCSSHPKRLKAVAMINIDDPSEGVREMERTAKLGASGFMLPIFPGLNCRYDHPKYEVLWNAAEDLNLPLSFHLGANRAALGSKFGIDLPQHATKDFHPQACVSILIFSGVFARHPKLKLMVVEFGTSWVFHLMNNLDRIYKANRDCQIFQFPDGELPSDYLRRNIYTTFQEDMPGIYLRDAIGVDNMLWGNDYPHAESTFPRSQEFLSKHFQGIPEIEAAKIAGGNAQKLYGFEDISISASQEKLCIK